MTEPTPATPDSAPALDVGRRVFARQARAEGRLSPWTRRDLAGKPIVRELRFAQRIARRVYGRGAPGVTFEGPLSPNAPRGVARFSEKVAERNTLADVARKYAPAENADAGDAAPKTAANTPLPLAGAGGPGGEGGASKTAAPVLSAAQALQRLAVVRPDLDPDASPFAKIFKAATSSAQPSESTLQRASDSGRRVVETFQRGGPKPKANAAPPAPIQPRTDRPPASIQRRADPSAPPPAAPPAATPPSQRPPATPSSRALRRFAKVEEVVPPNFTPPADDFGDDLPEPGAPAIQRALPPEVGEAMPLARRPEASPSAARAPTTVVQPRRPAVSAAAPKRQAKPAPAPARLQRRTAAASARPAPQVAPGRETPAPQSVPPAAPQQQAADAGGAPADRPDETARSPISIQRKPDAGQATPPAAQDRNSAPMTPRQPPQTRPAGKAADPAPPSSAADAPASAPIQREPLGGPNVELPLARPVQPEAPSNATPRESLAERAVEQTDLPGVTAPPAVASGARGAAGAPRSPTPIQRATSEEAAKELPLARPAEPPPSTPTPADIRPAASIQRAPIDDAATDLPLVRPSEPADIPPAASIQRAPIDDAATDLPLARPAEALPTAPAPPIQRAPIDDAANDLPLVRPPEPVTAPPAAAPPGAVIQRAPSDDAAEDFPLVRPPVPALTPAVAVQRQPIDDAAKDLPLVRPAEQAPPPPAAATQRQPIEDAAKEQPVARSSEPPAPTQAARREGPANSLPPAAAIQRQTDAGQPVDLPLARTAAPESPAAGEPSPRAPSSVPASDETPEAPPIRPRPSALNLARRAVQRILGEGPLPLPLPTAREAAPGQTPPTASTGDAPAPRPIANLTQRRVASAAIRPERSGSDTPPGPTTWADTDARPTAPMPARIQRASVAMPAIARATRSGETTQSGAAAPEMRLSADWGEQMPLVVPLLAAQSQSASRRIQREVDETPGVSASAAKATQSWQQPSPGRSAAKNSASAPTMGANPTAPAPALAPASPAKGNEPDLNYDLLAQRVYPFIRRLLAFERERERGS